MFVCLRECASGVSTCLSVKESVHQECQHVCLLKGVYIIQKCQHVCLLKGVYIRSVNMFVS